MESDKTAAELARQNIAINGWKRVQVIGEPSRLELLDSIIDFVKMDIEGGEEALLKLDEMPCPMRLEVHSKGPAEALSYKFGLETIDKERRNYPIIGTVNIKKEKRPEVISLRLRKV